MHPGRCPPLHTTAACALIAALLLPGTGSSAGDPRLQSRRRLRALPYVFIPLDPTRQQPLYFFGGRATSLPGVVSVDRPPYVCDVDGKTFTDGQRFVAHLHLAHQLPLASVPQAVIVYDGQVHFAGGRSGGPRRPAPPPAPPGGLPGAP